MLSQSQFTEQLYQKMLEHYKPSSHMPVKELKLLEHQIDVQGQHGEVFTCYTDKIYSRYLENPDFIKTIFAQTLQTYNDLFLYDENVFSGVLPIIKNQEWLDETHRMRVACNHGDDLSFARIMQDQMLTIPLVADLVIAFAISLPKGMKFLYQADLLRYSSDGSLNELYRKAKENLTAYLQELQIKSTPVGYTLELDTDIEASMLLLYEQWQNKLNFLAEPVIALISRDTVILADSSDHEQIHSLRKLTQELYPTVAYRLAPELYTIKNGMLELYESTVREV